MADDQASKTLSDYFQDTTNDPALPDTPRTYLYGRCRAIKMGTRTRCPEPVSTTVDADGVCDHHAQHNPYTIDAGPERLIAVTGRTRLHLTDIDPDSVDFDVELIRDGVRAVTSSGQGE